MSAQDILNTIADCHYQLLAMCGPGGHVDTSVHFNNAGGVMKDLDLHDTKQ